MLVVAETLQSNSKPPPIVNSVEAKAPGFNVEDASGIFGKLNELIAQSLAFDVTLQVSDVDPATPLILVNVFVPDTVNVASLDPKESVADNNLN